VTRTSSLRRIGVLVGLAAVYFAAGKVGLDLAFVHPSASAVWPPSGIALSALLILGYEVWPAVLVGAFLVNATTMGSPLTSLGIGVGNTLEGSSAPTWPIASPTGRKRLHAPATFSGLRPSPRSPVRR
jgi:integral membrane sensor domain MASE1